MARAYDRRAGDRRAERTTSSPAPHPILALQRAAGNAAVSQVVQRKRNFQSGKVLVTPRPEYYEGKCDATFGGGTVRKHWSPGMLMNDVTITFVCGPRSFKFRAAFPWVGDRYPWYAQYPGGEGWVRDEIEKALDTIDSKWDDEGAEFWAAYRKVKSTLQSDLQAFCAD